MRNGIFGGDSRYILTELRLVSWFHNPDSIGPETGGGSALGEKICLIEGAGAGKTSDNIAMAKHISACTPEIRLRSTLYPYRNPLLSLTRMADLLLLLTIPPLTPADISLKQYQASRHLEHLINFLPILLLVLATVLFNHLNLRSWSSNLELALS